MSKPQMLSEIGSEEPSTVHPSITVVTKNKDNWVLVWDERPREFDFYNTITGAKQTIEAERTRPTNSDMESNASTSSCFQPHLPSLHQKKEALKAALLAGYNHAVSQHAVSQLLLEYDGVDTNTPLFWTPTSTSTTPLQWAVVQDNLDLVTLFLTSHKEGKQPPLLNLLGGLLSALEIRSASV
ncbi:kinase-like domain-containing protein [Apiospora phragmitis]|uniref:Kinase-like domain-containing protein n=1 Tax=Apiospora phragmitis TaxID=2905665 RepID=A0ABR1T8K8_9PEZI